MITLEDQLEDITSFRHNTLHKILDFDIDTAVHIRLLEGVIMKKFFVISAMFLYQSAQASDAPEQIIEVCGETKMIGKMAGPSFGTIDGSAQLSKNQKLTKSIIADDLKALSFREITVDSTTSADRLYQVVEDLVFKAKLYDNKPLLLAFPVPKDLNIHYVSSMYIKTNTSEHSKPDDFDNISEIRRPCVAIAIGERIDEVWMNAGRFYTSDTTKSIKSFYEIKLEIENFYRELSNSVLQKASMSLE